MFLYTFAYNVLILVHFGISFGNSDQQGVQSFKFEHVPYRKRSQEPDNDLNFIMWAIAYEHLLLYHSSNILTLKLYCSVDYISVISLS